MTTDATYYEIDHETLGDRAHFLTLEDADHCYTACFPDQPTALEVRGSRVYDEQDRQVGWVRQGQPDPDLLVTPSDDRRTPVHETIHR